MNKFKMPVLTGTVLFSLLLLTGCTNGDPVAPTTATPSSSSMANDSKTDDSTQAESSTKDTESEPTTEPTFEAKDYDSIEEIDFDLMFNNNVHPDVYEVFSEDDVITGSLTGLSYIDTLIGYPKFYQAREPGSDAEIFSDPAIKDQMTPKLLEDIHKGIEKEKRFTGIPTANLKGEVRFRVAVGIKLDGVPESKYDTPTIVVGQNGDGKTVLAVTGRRTIFFKDVNGKTGMKKTVEYRVILIPSDDGWKVSGIGFKTINPNKLLDSEGKEV